MRILGTETSLLTRIFTGLFSGVLAVLLISTTAFAQDTNSADTLLSPAQWKSFEANVASGIRSENDGVRRSALGQIAKFGGYMDFTHDDVIVVVRSYREESVFRNRQLAITAIGQMNNRWGIEFLDMLRATETSEQLKNTMISVIDAYWESHGGNPYKD